MSKRLFILGALLCPLALYAAPKKFETPVITKKTPGHQADIEIDITGAKSLYLEVTDGGDGTRYDWADWIEPRLIGPQGEKKLTDLKWKQSKDRTFINKNQGKGPLIVNGKAIAYGIGTHAASLIVYDLPPGYTTFQARGGIDQGGISQAGSTSSIRFRAYTGKDTAFANPLNLNLPNGFQAEKLYDANLKQEGSWVVMCVDPKGRLIVSDRKGPMYRITVPPIGDRETKTKVERLPVEVGHANGLLFAFDGFYVTGKGFGKHNKKSGLFRLRDTTGDDHFDRVEHLIALQVGSDHHAHSIVLSPEGDRLFLLSGNSTDLPKGIVAKHIQHQSEDHLLPRSTYYGHNTGRLAPGGFAISFTPEGKDIRLFSAGFRNPYDFAFNADGELFVWDADMEYDVGGPWYRPTRVNHSVSGADFGWRFGAGKWPNWFPDTVGTVTDIGRGSPTGVTFGYGARFPAKYQSAYFICDWTYGKMYAVHLKENGATYTGDFETFMAGRAFPLSDVVIHPGDGAMYCITGGRRKQSQLVRITYKGSDSVDAIDLKPKQNPARKLRHRLEALHGSQNPKAVDTAWPHLSHTDRAIRFAARTAIEHQPIDSWRKRAEKESNPLAVIELAVAWARTGEKSTAPKLISLLNKLEPGKLAVEQQLDLLRAYGLAFIRLAEPDSKTVELLHTRLDPLYPSGHHALDRELCQMLLYLNAPQAVSKTIQKLLQANTQADEMFYAYHLRTIKEGWTPDDRKAYFGWIQNAQSNKGDYTGGGHFRNFVNMVKKENTKLLSDEEKEQLKTVWVAKEKPVPQPWAPRKTVRNWTVEELKPALDRVETGRAFLQGKKLYNGLCANCHLFKGQGGAIGPDLTSVGGKLKYEELLTDIIEPSKLISDQYASVMVTLKSGAVVVGREVGGDASILKLATNPADPEHIEDVKLAEIKKKAVTPISMMPPGLLDTLTKEEILDVLMYISSGGNVGHTAFQF